MSVSGWTGVDGKGRRWRKRMIEENVWKAGKRRRDGR